ncbi:MAG: 30S ribosomal protein S16 [Cyanobacteria bacterium P01_H01_bin.74]
MVRIRLKRIGRKHAPFYRIVAINGHSRREGSPLEELGYYNPMKKAVKLNLARVKELIAQGASPSERVAWLLTKLKDDYAGEAIQLELTKPEKLSRKAAEKAKSVKEEAQSA